MKRKGVLIQKNRIISLDWNCFCFFFFFFNHVLQFHCMPRDKVKTPGKDIQEEFGTTVQWHMCALGLMPGQFSMSQGIIKRKSSKQPWQHFYGSQQRGCNSAAEVRVVPGNQVGAQLCNLSQTKGTCREMALSGILTRGMLLLSTHLFIRSHTHDFRNQPVNDLLGHNPFIVFPLYWKNTSIESPFSHYRPH